MQKIISAILFLVILTQLSGAQELEEGSNSAAISESRETDFRTWDRYTERIDSCDGVCTREDEIAELQAGEDRIVIDTGETGFCGEAGYVKRDVQIPDNARNLSITFEGSWSFWAADAGFRIENSETGETWLFRHNAKGEKYSTGGKKTVTRDISNYSGETVDLRVLVEDRSKEWCNMRDHPIEFSLHDVAITAEETDRKENRKPSWIDRLPFIGGEKDDGTEDGTGADLVIKNPELGRSELETGSGGLQPASGLVYSLSIEAENLGSSRAKNLEVLPEESDHIAPIRWSGSSISDIEPGETVELSGIKFNIKSGDPERLEIPVKIVYSSSGEEQVREETVVIDGGGKNQGEYCSYDWQCKTGEQANQCITGGDDGHPSGVCCPSGTNWNGDYCEAKLDIVAVPAHYESQERFENSVRKKVERWVKKSPLKETENPMGRVDLHFLEISKIDKASTKDTTRLLRWGDRQVRQSRYNHLHDLSIISTTASDESFQVKLEGSSAMLQGVAGSSFLGSKNLLVLHSTNSITLSHEIGHSFGLGHTTKEIPATELYKIPLEAVSGVEQTFIFPTGFDMPPGCSAHRSEDIDYPNDANSDGLEAIMNYCPTGVKNEKYSNNYEPEEGYRTEYGVLREQFVKEGWMPE